MAAIYTLTSFEIKCVFEINVHYVNKKKLDDRNNMSLKYPCEVLEEVGNGSDGQAKNGLQSRTFYMDADF